MNEKLRTLPPLFIGACTFFCLGVMVLLYTLLHLEQTAYPKGWLLISISFIGFGAGEMLNHPKERVAWQDGQENTDIGFYRRRNTCGLGNLLDIMALLLFFSGLSAIFP